MDVIVIGAGPAGVPLSVPTYAGILGRAAYRAAQQLNLEPSWQAHQVED